MQKFRDQITGQMTELKEVSSSHDSAGLARFAHSIKGSSANLSAESVRQRAFELEQLARADGADAGAAVQGLIDAVEELLSYLPSADKAVEKSAAGTPVE